LPVFYFLSLFSSFWWKLEPTGIIQLNKRFVGWNEKCKQNKKVKEMEKLFFEVVDKDASSGNQKIEKRCWKYFEQMCKVRLQWYNLG